MAPLLLVSVFVIATCGLIYELIAGTLASYLLGDSVTQFSTIIGCYLFAMGIGSWLSRYVNKNLLGVFVEVEILIGLIGGSSAALLFVLFEHIYSFHFLLYFVVTVIGVLVGLEIPLLLRILESRFEFKDLVSKVFSLDYVGALFASVLFPLVLIPYLGLVRTSFSFGMGNVLVAFWMLLMMRERIPGYRWHLGTAAIVLALLSAGFVYSERIMSFAEASTYPGKVILSESTPYQRIVITEQSGDVRLFLNANLQFSSVDEYRYHEALVHPALSAHPSPRNVLIIGGGDGLALREVLKYPSVAKVTMVDLDPEMTRLFSTNALLTALNGQSLLSKKLTIINKDAFTWLKEQRDNAGGGIYDIILIDVPDPSNFSIGKLYTVTFYKLLRSVTDEDSIVVVQSTSPLVARKSFWCVTNTLKAAGFETAAYHAFVPSFGEWGFTIATNKPYASPKSYPSGLKYLNVETADDMFHFAPDMAWVETKIQRLDDQALIHYFDEEWSKYLIY
ncbi:polyamine aminopropyltransferase [Pleomorphomonas oryzae]|uniref:polyamine aminopropyltransferase n=1 Tax=Pleomorphomonas oryzae TaxID=261934 RepID=UPI0004290629|nr:polyamine aminopropyltransferase [Pleomorphomonas oryzae]